MCSFGSRAQVYHFADSLSKEMGASRLRFVRYSAGALEAGVEEHSVDVVSVRAIQGIRLFLLKPLTAAPREQSFEGAWPAGGPWMARR